AARDGRLLDDADAQDAPQVALRGGMSLAELPVALEARHAEHLLLEEGEHLGVAVERVAVFAQRQLVGARGQHPLVPAVDVDLLDALHQVDQARQRNSQETWAMVPFTTSWRNTGSWASRCAVAPYRPNRPGCSIAWSTRSLTRSKRRSSSRVDA